MACSLKPSQVAPVGDAFLLYKQKYGEEEFLKLLMKAEDDHHASVKGAYLSACVHFSMIFGEKCSGNSFRASWKSKKPGKNYGKMYTLSEESAVKLQGIADEVTGTKTKRNKYRFGANEDCEISYCALKG